MRTKTATLALLVLIAASKAAPLPDRPSFSYAQHQALHKRASTVCNDEARGKGVCYLRPSASQRRSAEDIDEPTAVKADTPEQSSPSSVKPEESGKDDAVLEGNEEPSAADQETLSSPGSPPQSPDRASESPPSSSTPSDAAVPTVSDKPGPPNAQVPHHPPPPAANAMTPGEDKNYKWFGNSVFRILGGLF